METDINPRRIFEETRALLDGHFELRSGLHSNQYFQCALVLQYPRQAEVLCRALGARVAAALEGPPAGVIAPALGGIPVGHELGRYFGTKAIFAEKQEGRLVLRRGFAIEPGAAYVVGEDVITRGGRVQETMDIVTGRGGVVAAVAVLVNRSGGAFQPEVPLVSLLEMTPVTWAPTDCPLCRAGVPIDHPGS
ncbi:MAG: orotate phosphoribosyltransferase [Candidatus Marinimicrobia bacterium]|nr:orotate phosphoribosyltransferase [Candidatus Neomarinimicrobiota bacterium]